MFKLKKRLVIDVLVFSVIIIGIGFYNMRVHEKEISELKIIHCANINKDFTRPDGRICQNPISIEDSHFIFETKNGGKEEYLVQENGDEFIYVFERMISEVVNDVSS